MKKVQSISLLVVLVVLLAVSNVSANCYTDKCKSSNNGRPIIINRMNGIDTQARSDIKVLESKNADQDKEIGNIKSDITTLDTSIKNVASDVKTLDGNIKKVDDKAEAAGKKADEANQKNVIQDNNSFWTAVIISLIVLVALGFALAAFFRRQHNNNQLQGQQNQAGNQNNGQQFQNGFGYQQPGQNPQVIGPFWGTAPQFHLQWGLPTVVGNNQNQQQPVPANPPVGNNP